MNSSMNLGGAHMIAHRGYSAMAPENTLPAFKLAGENGFWGAECDTSPTADGVWVVMHDDTVDRTTSGEGPVNSFTFDEIRALTIDGGNHPEQFPEANVPLLSEYLDVCKAYGLHCVIEIKDCTPVDLLPDLAALLGAREEKERFTIISFGREHCLRMKALMPETPVLFLTGDFNTDDFGENIQFCLDNGLDGLDFNCDWGDEAHVKEAIAAGLQTMIWTADDLDIIKKYYGWGVRDFTSNAIPPKAIEGLF
ncbi:MAG: hypothetical protein IJU96_05830 [Clostridia bacterium]|nr:hypothetical protein [Clostridia bacterium]